MRGIRFVTIALAALVTATMGVASTADAAGVDPKLRADLENIAPRRIFFGHQSVGENLLDGVRRLAEAAGVPVRVVETPTASGVAPATFGHTAVAMNRYPLQKLQNFDLALGQQATGLDIALVKFCYLDIDASTDVKALFASYRAAIEKLRARNPGTTFVHVTAPLTTVRGGAKEILKQLIGRAPYGAVENIRREEYNALLRQAYREREPIFDLARIESTAPDGTEVTFDWKGRVAPTLAPAYTDDGSHLNGAGRLRAARELVSILAAVPNRPVAGQPVR